MTGEIRTEQEQIRKCKTAVAKCSHGTLLSHPPLRHDIKRHGVSCMQATLQWGMRAYHIYIDTYGFETFLVLTFH